MDVVSISRLMVLMNTIGLRRNTLNGVPIDSIMSLRPQILTVVPRAVVLDRVVVAREIEKARKASKIGVSLSLSLSVYSPLYIV